MSLGVLEKRKSHVPDYVATFDDNIGVRESLVGNHGSVHDLESFNSSLEVFQLDLERVKLHTCLRINVGGWSSEEELSFGVFIPNLCS